MLNLKLKTLIDFHILHSTNKYTGSLQFRTNYYLALLITLLIRLVRHMPISLCACVSAYPTTFHQENTRSKKLHCIRYPFKMSRTKCRGKNVAIKMSRTKMSLNDNVA